MWKVVFQHRMPAAAHGRTCAHNGTICCAYMPENDAKVTDALSHQEADPHGIEHSDVYDAGVRLSAQNMCPWPVFALFEEQVYRYSLAVAVAQQPCSQPSGK